MKRAETSGEHKRCKSVIRPIFRLNDAQDLRKQGWQLAEGEEKEEEERSDLNVFPGALLSFENSYMRQQGAMTQP